MRSVVALIGTIALGAIFYGFWLPSAWHVERSLTLSAPKARVFPYLSTASLWPQWAMPAGLSPEITDKRITWAGGTQIDLTEIVPDTSVAYELHYVGVDRPMRGKLTLSGETTVTWSDDGDMGKNPIARYFMSRIVHDVGADMEVGLQRLKTQVEQQ